VRRPYKRPDCILIFRLRLTTGSNPANTLTHPKVVFCRLVRLFALIFVRFRIWLHARPCRSGRGTADRRFAE
jgi:hypothetical protein